jgi:hypothetical protein
MTARDLIELWLTPAQLQEVNARIDAAMEAAEAVDGGTDRACRVLAELRKGLSDVEVMALVVGVTVGRMSR